MKLIILDRDGVLNEEREDYIKSPEEWEPIESSMSAVARLNEAGYSVVLATNQSVIGRGIIDMAMLNKIHQKMHSTLGRHGGWVDAIYFCPDAPDANCDCRKPKPGLLYEIARRCKTELADVWMVGDALADVQAALAGGAKPALVRTGYGAKTEEEGNLPDEIPIFDNLHDFVVNLLQPSE